MFTVPDQFSQHEHQEVARVCEQCRHPKEDFAIIRKGDDVAVVWIPSGKGRRYKAFDDGQSWTTPFKADLIDQYFRMV
jgi:hypothetical protein